MPLRTIVAALLAQSMLIQGSPALATPPPAGAAAFDHLALQVADLERSVAFYRRIFDLRELPAPMAGPRWLSLGGMLALHLVPGRSAPVADNRFVHFALTVADFDGMLARLRAEKIPFGDSAGNVGAINRVRGDGVRQIFLRDPDGYWIEVNDVAKPAS